MHVVFAKSWKTIDTFVLKQKSVYIWVDKIFAKTLKTSYLRLFEPSELQDLSLFLLYDV